MLKRKRTRPERGRRTVGDTLERLAPLLERVEIVEAELVAGD